ncbi:MAG: hypothetical protein BWY80_00949 [Firmicutes bacterium ADurb.Bin456]|nr:MAG: hypothetical protein BWY80_00949 [Firmicutes bacterium ADurb.Bin456]
MNKSLDLTAAQTSIIARQNDTIHRLVGQNEHLTLTLTTGNERPALPEPSQEQGRTVEEMAEPRTEPIQNSPEVEPNHTEPIQAQDKQPLPVGDALEVPHAVELGKSLGVSFGNDTVRRAVKAGVLVALPGRPMKIRSEDIRVFALEYAKIGELPKMPQIRKGKVV